ncbi:MAG TPA: SCP2 sterol-binding domain-containing protein [candidate division Zixibacteria bacterium]|nr:SCP2 sterol-binding domain-containing protein [candidate division Zixibacteria bacterium]
MAILFPTEEWIKAAMVEVNKSAEYKKAANNWEGDIIFAVTAVPDKREGVFMYMDLWHGECRDAFEVVDPSNQSSEFVINGPLPVWRKVLEGKVDPIRALVSRQLKMKGNMMKVLKAPKAAVELVNACQKVDTEWPA